ncbi:MAG: FHA domain-containing protein [Micromonosporaceae bacterium]|jgi:hypothetical protein
MRFSISATLDAIETRLSLDPALARAVVDVTEVVRLVALDGDTGRPARLTRLGHVIDALTRHLGEDGVVVYPVVARSVLSDQDLSSNERMVVRRWVDDGLVDMLADPGDRVLEVAEALSVPVVGGRGLERYADRYPWVATALLSPGPSGLAGRGEPPAVPGASRLLGRLWQCREPGCVGFGRPRGDQRPPRLVGGAPTCPLHGARLTDAGPRPPARALVVSVDGTVRSRFVVRQDAPVVVGRAPEAPPGARAVTLAAWLGATAMRWVSRTHLRLEVRGGTLAVVDLSTNGTRLRTASGTVRLVAGHPHPVGAHDVIELSDGVLLAPPGVLSVRAAPSGSIMAEAPTVAIRRP